MECCSKLVAERRTTLDGVRPPPAGNIREEGGERAHFFDSLRLYQDHQGVESWNPSTAALRLSVARDLIFNRPLF